MNSLLYSFSLAYQSLIHKYSWKFIFSLVFGVFPAGIFQHVMSLLVFIYLFLYICFYRIYYHILRIFLLGFNHRIFQFFSRLLIVFYFLFLFLFIFYLFLFICCCILIPSSRKVGDFICLKNFSHLLLLLSLLSVP